MPCWTEVQLVGSVPVNYAAGDLIEFLRRLHEHGNPDDETAEDFEKLLAKFQKAVRHDLGIVD
jgi:hypothetical protein